MISRYINNIFILLYNKLVDKMQSKCLLQKTSVLSPLMYDDYFNDIHFHDIGDDEFFQPPDDKESEAKGVVIGMTMTNAFVGAATAQFPGADEIALGAVEVAMGLKIIKGVYGFAFDEALIKSILLAVKATVTGKVIAKATSKAVTWIPVIGNIINAGVAGYTTKAFGYALVEECEKIRQELARGKKIDEILNG